MSTTGRWLGMALAAGAGVLLAAGSANAVLTPGSGIHIKYQIDDALVSVIDRTSDSQLVGGQLATTVALRTVQLNAGPVGPVLYTQPDSVPGLPWVSRFIATDGSYALTGQTGGYENGVFSGRLFLTAMSDGSSSELSVPGNWDGAANGAGFYVAAAAGTSTGVASNSSSGLYHVEQTGGILTGLNLILDTGAPSGSLCVDANGDLAFTVGGSSAALSGASGDLYRLSASHVAAGIAAGPTTGVAGSTADKLISGNTMVAAVAPLLAGPIPTDGFDYISISDLVFDAHGDLIVSMTREVYDSNFSVVNSYGAGLLLDIAHSGEDYSGAVARVLYTHSSAGGGSLAYRATDETLWVATGGSIYGLSLPEPASALLLGLGFSLVKRRWR